MLPILIESAQGPRNPLLNANFAREKFQQRTQLLQPSVSEKHLIELAVFSCSVSPRKAVAILGEKRNNNKKVKIYVRETKSHGHLTLSVRCTVKVAWLGLISLRACAIRGHLTNQRRYC